MNIAIIYHSADWDGKLSNEVCRFHLAKQYPGATISSIGWDYGQPVPLLDPKAHDQIYMVDLCIDALMEDEEIQKKLIWIDHHASAIEKWGHLWIRGLRIDGVAACRLCWYWCRHLILRNGKLEPTPTCVEVVGREPFFNRTVLEPELIRLAGEYDVFDHRDERALPLQFGLSTLGDDGLKVLIRGQFLNEADGEIDLVKTIHAGGLIKIYIDKRNAEHALANAVTVKFAGLTCCCLNVGQPGNSQMFTAALKDEHQACLAWRHTGKAVSVSLYSIPGKSTNGILEIAQSFGGGGHKGACGFRVTMDTMRRILDGTHYGDGRLE